MRQDIGGTEPTLLEAIRAVMDRVMIDMHTCTPAKIVAYHSATQTADVQPQLQRRFANQTLVSLPVVYGVPVVHPRANGGKVRIHLPLTAGDDVTLVFCERSLDNWKVKGGLTDPNDPRRFNLSDCFAIPGGSAEPDAFPVEDPADIEIINENSKLKIKKTGKYKIEGGNSDELIDLLSDLVKSLQDSRTVTALGPEPLIDPSDPGFVLLKQRIDAFKA